MFPSNLIRHIATTAILLGATLLRAAEWKEIDGVRVPIPPALHPRLYLNPAEVRDLSARTNDPSLRTAYERLSELGRREPQWSLEARALQCLLDPSQKDGRKLVLDTLEALKGVTLGKNQDGARATGRWMVTGALIYDWFYPMIEASEKKLFIAELVRLAGTLECGYPPVKQSSVVSHTSEAMLMRDLLSAGIAIYDEFPEMYDLAARRFFAEHLPVRNWIYRGGAYHQGDSYGPYRFGWDLFPLFIFDRMGFPQIYDSSQRWVPYYYLYSTRPDGQRLRAGDSFATAPPRGEPWNEGFTPLFTASYYHDNHLYTHALEHGKVRDSDALFEFLWRDPTLTAVTNNELPLSAYFGSPFGWIIARTGWGLDAAMADMRVNEYYFANHQHFDAGSFQLYYRGSLAIDSGLYKGSSGAYGSPHCKNYSWRTIAHNSLLIYDPTEKFDGDRGHYRNDGGQRLPNNRIEPNTLEELLTAGYRTGQVLAAGFGPDPVRPAYTVLSGDITAAYSKKVKHVERTGIFLNLGLPHLPAAFIVYDQVVSTDPTFRKFWLLHSQEEPQLDANSAIIDCTRPEEGGRLRLDVLLPRKEDLDLSKIGGPGKEYWVFGENQTNDANLGDSSLEPGAWRIEISPKASKNEAEFLTVMQLTDRDAPRQLTVSAVDVGEDRGCLLRDINTFWQLRFIRSTAEDRRPITTLVIEAATSGVGHYLVFGVSPGKWTIRAATGAILVTTEVDAKTKCLWFEAPAGKYSASLDSTP